MVELAEPKIAEIHYAPHEHQAVIHEDEARFRIIVCGRRWGKTTLAVNECIKEAIVKPTARVWYIAPTYRQAKNIAYKMFKKYIPAEFVVKAKEMELTFELINGSEIALKGADNEDSLRGVGLDFVVLDEFSDMKVNVWEEIVRPMLTDTQGRALFIGTPKGKNHFWDLWMKGQREENGYKSWRFKTIDNPYVFDEEIQEAKAQLSERCFRQEYEASFEDYTGLIWPEFSPKQHVIDPIPLESYWDRVGAIDPAISGTTGCLACAITERGELLIYAEYCEENKRANDVAQTIKSFGVGDWLIDPAANAKTIQRDSQLYSLQDEYVDSGIYARNAQKDIDAGINRVAEYFKAGKIKIFSTCRHLIYELERYHWSEERETVSGVLKPKPYKTHDHLCDALRYIVMSRPSLSQKPPVPYDVKHLKAKNLLKFGKKLVSNEIEPPKYISR